MRSTAEGPTGLGRRGRRRSDRETRQRMLAAAVAMVNRTGLTVSLDHISFEDLIRDADVSRSAVYRHWPHKDLFFGDLVMELARTATPAIEEAEAEKLRQVVAEHPDWLSTPQLRRSLMLELIRQLAWFDFETLSASPQWRTYVALHAAFLSLADGELREQVSAALAQSEREHTARVAHAWEQLSALFGYRLRPRLGVTFQNLAMLLEATMRGLVVMGLSTPEAGSYRATAVPAGAAGPNDWSLAALGAASLADMFLEPDPAAEWSDERVAALRQILTANPLTLGS